MKRMGKNVLLTPLEFVREQVLLLHPFLFPIWIAGLVSFLVGRGSRLRVLGWTYLVLLAAMIVLKAKNYYLAPIYPMLFASGAVAWEGWLERRAWSRGRLWPKAATAAYVLAAGAFVAPAILPILPPEKLLAYERRIGAAPPKTEVRHEGPLEQRLGRPVRLGGARRRCRTDLSIAAARGARADRNLCQQLRRGGRDRSLRSGPGPAAGDLRAPEPLLLGPADDRSREPHLAAMEPRVDRDAASVEQSRREHSTRGAWPKKIAPIYLCRGLRAPARRAVAELETLELSSLRKIIRP